MINTDGQIVSKWRYMTFGEGQTPLALEWGLHPQTPRHKAAAAAGCTGQRNYSDFGLMDYHARFYSPRLGRFVQPDTIVPELGNNQAWDWYSYAINNPIKYMDPTGHIACEDLGTEACGNDGGYTGEDIAGTYADNEEILDYVAGAGGANYYHEVVQIYPPWGDMKGTSAQDFALSGVGINIGSQISLNLISPAELANVLRHKLGPNGPGSNGFVGLFGDNWPIPVLPSGFVGSPYIP